jgi:trafficking protein particle complex subunit 5
MASAQPGKPPLTAPVSQSQRGSAPGLRYPSSGKTIYHRPLNRSRTQELSQAAFAYLFGEMVSYAQKRVTGIQDLEKRYGNSLSVNSQLSKIYPSIQYDLQG